MHAVVRIGASQYDVQPGMELLVNLLPQTSGTINFDQVLLVIDGVDVHVGQPYLANYTVVATVLGVEKGDKVRVFKYKAKSRYRKTTGIRPRFTKLRIDSIGTAHVVPAVVNDKPKPKTKVKPQVKKPVRETKS